MSAVTLSRITADDIKIYADIENSVIDPKTYPWTVTSEEAAERIGDKNFSYFIKKDGRIVGNLRYRMKAPDHAYITSIVVRPEFQGQGIGREAMEILISGELNGVRRIDLVTHPDNTKAIAMYTKLGFVAESKKENYYGDGEPRLVMSKTLEP